MKRTIYLPEHLDGQLDKYLKEHPSETLSSLVQEVLEVKLVPKDISKLLALSGIVAEAPHNSSDHAEDYGD